MSDDTLGPLGAVAWKGIGCVTGFTILALDGEPLHNHAPWTPLYELPPEDVAAVNAARKARAEKALRRLDLCRCDHNEYCKHCHPVEFRPGGVWGASA